MSQAVLEIRYHPHTMNNLKKIKYQISAYYKINAENEG
jgi:hypothetical protein